MELIDDYSHDIPGVIYFPTSLPSKEIQTLFNQTLEGCNCEGECNITTRCSCSSRSGTFYKYVNIYDLQNYTIHENIENSTYECNENCSCHDKICGNRLLQYGPRKDLWVQLCQEDKGLGLFTQQEIKKGNFVCEYAGEIITEHLALERFKQNSEHNINNYIFCVKEHCGGKTIKTFIDPTHYGNIGRYINHSCEPNCKLFVVRINGVVPILGIFAEKDIKENSEITYDYGEGEIYLENQEKHTQQKKCFCKSENCRKYLPFDISLLHK